MAIIQSSGMITRGSPPWYCPRCGFGPHNPHIDVGCANCGHIPNMRNGNTEQQTMADFAGQSSLQICSMTSIEPMASPIVLPVGPSGDSKDFGLSPVLELSSPLSGPLDKGPFYNASETNPVTTINTPHLY